MLVTCVRVLWCRCSPLPDLDVSYESWQIDIEFESTVTLWRHGMSTRGALWWRVHSSSRHAHCNCNTFLYYFRYPFIAAFRPVDALKCCAEIYFPVHRTEVKPFHKIALWDSNSFIVDAILLHGDCVQSELPHALLWFYTSFNLECYSARIHCI